MHNMNVKSLLFGSALALGMLALALVAGLPGRATRAQAATQTWYVDGNCAICGDGTMSSPFQTINRALFFADDGDTILVAQGTYVENLNIYIPVTLMGGYGTTSPTWTRDIARYETIVTSDYRTVAGDWDGDWLGSSSVVKDDSTYRMWYSAGNDIGGESIGYADSPDGVNWFKPRSDPLLEAGPSGAWDEAGVANPAVLATDSGFQMWYIGLDMVGVKAIGYAASPDGLTWQKYDGNPVLRSDFAVDIAFGFPTVVQDSPNDYKMWYSVGSSIFLATSSDGLNWTQHLDAPALEPTWSSGAWDDVQVYAPQVIARAGGYEMWYVGRGATTPGPSIGYAWSGDGLNWTRSPHNPVLTGTTGTWEEGKSAYPAVIKGGVTSYEMWYRGGGDGGGAFGQATSSDGVIWAKYGGNPVLSRGRSTRWGRPVIFFGRSSGEAVTDGLTITGGSAGYGGGIYVYGASPAIRNCTVTGNVAQSGGGGMHIVSGAPLIESTVVSGNTSVAGWAGGVLVGQASPTISASLITDNVASGSGGGLVMWRALQPTLIATTVANNTASAGGGILLGNGSVLRVYDSRIDGNTAGQMAGMWVDYHNTLVMTNTFVVNNHAVAGGPGAMSFSRSSGRLVNVTIAGNSASDGPGGIAFDTSQPGENLVILNSILAFNGADDLSCSSDTCSVTYSDVQEDIAGSGNISADPRFVDRAKGDYHLRGDSPAIDAGTSEGAPAADFEGDPRPVGGVDMGADEFSGDLVDVFLPLILRDF
jgi:hypothetical protein